MLVRTDAQLPVIHARWRRAASPVEVVGLGGLLALPEVADLVAVLEVLDDPTANAALVRLLTGPRWRIGPRDLALLGRRAAELVRPAGPHGPDAEPGTTSTAAEPARQDGGVDPAEVVSLADALDGPGDRARYSPRRWPASPASRRSCASCGGTCGEPAARRCTGCRDDRARRRGRGRRRRAGAARARRLASFLDAAALRRPRRRPGRCRAFLAFLAAADRLRARLDPPPRRPGDTVKLMTVHKAKGLEWDVVGCPT